MKNLQSFGPYKHYQLVINNVSTNKWYWKKVANLINTIRQNLRPWEFVDRENQRKATYEYIVNALRDTKLPPHVVEPLKTAITSEFGFTFKA
jgi:hypothetical protein